MAEMVVPIVLNRLTDMVQARAILILGVEKEVNDLSDKFATLGKVLGDAGRRSFREDVVRAWLEKLEDITYEMEDVLEEWSLSVKLKSARGISAERAEKKPVDDLLEKVRSFIPSLCSCIKRVPVRNHVALKIKEINAKLESILIEANQFSFASCVQVVKNDEFKRPMSTSIFDESEVRGRDSDKDSLLRLLCDNSSDSVKVISIVGAGGSGKTTLAQFLYNDEGVSSRFELKEWVCVSDPFDEHRIAKALTENLEKGGDIHEHKSKLELESLFQRVREVFSGKRFLLVFDDVWTDKHSQWEPFRNSLKDGAPGSIILVTTRKESVTRVVGTDHKHDVCLLSNADCWSIIKHVALSKRLDKLCERVEGVGLKIAEKCRGLPLAAKTLGGLLQFKDTLQEWQEVLESEIWNIEEAAHDLFPHFYLSYKELSPQLKRCFLYSAIFVKDTYINVDRLIQLWMAQGYLSHPIQNSDCRMEKRGYEYFKLLSMRSFFQELEKDRLDENKIDFCKMHDMVHDFAQFISKSGSRVFKETDCRNLKSETPFNERLCHVRMLGQVKSVNSSLIPNIGKVRSLFLSSLDGELPHDLCNSLRSVRSLTLFGCKLQELPREIGSLIHLRLLDVRRNEFTELPGSICNLHFLETLDMKGCWRLKLFPERIGDLIHLRHLMNYGADKVKQMPCGIEKLTSLRTLTQFSPSANGASFNHLAKLKLLERCSIDFPQNLGPVSESWMEMLELPPNLQVLCIRYYPLARLPVYISASHLKVLVVEDATQISSLPVLGKMASLEILRLFDLPNLKHVSDELYGLQDLKTENHHKEDVAQVVAFPCLKELQISGLPNWATWKDISDEDDQLIKKGFVSVMPRLESLKIILCPKLEGLPHRILGNLSSLKELYLYMTDKLKERYSNKAGEDWKKISHIPEINFRGRGSQINFQLRRRRIPTSIS